MTVNSLLSERLVSKGSLLSFLNDVYDVGKQTFLRGREVIHRGLETRRFRSVPRSFPRLLSGLGNFIFIFVTIRTPPSLLTSARKRARSKHGKTTVCARKIACFLRWLCSSCILSDGGPISAHLVLFLLTLRI